MIMTDIVERLYAMQRTCEKMDLPSTSRMYQEAADKIKRLREHLDASEERYEDLWKHGLMLEAEIELLRAEISELKRLAR